MENIDDFATCKLTNITSANSKRPHQKPVFLNNGTSVSHFERRKKEQIFASLKII